ASKFSEEGTTIRLDMRLPCDGALLSVSDEGIGMEPDECVAMFELFAQGERARRFRNGGLGLGLWVVREIVRAHGGRVSARSAGAGRGTTLTLALPGVLRASPACCAARRLRSDVDVARDQRVLGDERAPRLDVVAHQRGEDAVGGDRIVDAHAQQTT